MKTYFCFAAVLLAGLFLFCGCTGSPFGESEISAGSRQIHGQIALSRNLDPQGVFVWLEGVDIGTRTDKNGRFDLILPPLSSQSVRGGVSGVFDLYFYLANFAPTTTRVALRNGAFVYSQGEIDEDGGLYAAKFIPELLEINTIVSPVSVPADYQDTVLVETKLRAVSGTVDVLFPKTFVGRLGAIFFRNLDTGEVLTFQFFPGTVLNHVEKVGRVTYTAIAVIYPRRMNLAPAKYEVIPYLLVPKPAVPMALIASLGDSVEALGPDYLNIPFGREGGGFEVQ